MSAEATIERTGTDDARAVPLEPFVVGAGGRTVPFAVEDRTPVLVLGGDGASLHLGRQLAGERGHVPVSRAVVYGHVAVFAARLTDHPKLAATLAEFEGAVSYLAVAWLMPDQLERMHAVEAVGKASDFAVLSGRLVRHDIDLPHAPDVGVHLRRPGPLLHGGRPIRLAETATAGCPFPALLQSAALRYVRHRAAPELDHAAFVERLRTDPDFRAACTDRLTTH